jgi:hypothetical protein
MAKAKLIYRDKSSFPDGHIVEMMIWCLPEPETGRAHGLKYSLFYGRDGERIVGYDNERGKGDHRHYRHTERPYQFIDVETLVADFLRDVEMERDIL